MTCDHKHFRLGVWLLSICLPVALALAGFTYWVWQGAEARADVLETRIIQTEKTNAVLLQELRDFRRETDRRLDTIEKKLDKRN